MDSETQTIEQRSGQDILERLLRHVAAGLCAFLTLFTVYTTLYGQLSAMMQRGIFLLAGGAAFFFLTHFQPAWAKSPKLGLRILERAVNLSFVALLAFAVVYLFLNYFDIAQSREGLPNTWDVIAYSAGTIVVLEGIRRTDGWEVFLMVLGVLAYLFWGHHIPGVLGHRAIGFEEVAEMCFGMNGVFGVALAVVVNVVYIFIIFGALLKLSGAGDLFIDLAYMLTGRFPGGPAQCSVVASNLFGSINGSGPANVVGIGTFTIPLMIRYGYKPEFAGGVEAAASCVGQIMPPVMGVGAFIMAELTGISYSTICLAALAPALLYSFSLMVVVRLRAQQMGLRPIPKEEIVKFRWDMLPRLGVLGLGIAGILYPVLTDQTPNMAGLTGCAALLAGSFFVKSMRPDLKKLWSILVDGGKDGLSLTVSCAGVGILIGAIAITGIGVKFSQAIVGLGAENLFLALVMAALCCTLVGLGLPTAASYLMVVYIAAPALTKLGLPLLATHLFIFYFAVLSAISPPVALCAVAAAGIAGSDIQRTGWLAMRIGAVGFFLPFLWIYNPELMLVGAQPWPVLKAVVTVSLATVALGAVNVGFLRRPLKWWERGALLAVAVALAGHYDWLDALGLAGGAFMYFFVLKPAPQGSVHKIAV